jgi:hypothetical protein
MLCSQIFYRHIVEHESSKAVPESPIRCRGSSVPNLDITGDEASCVYIALKPLKDFFSGRGPDATSSLTQDLGHGGKWETCLKWPRKEFQSALLFVNLAA